MADTVVKDIKHGKLPFKKDFERISKYGQGFSYNLRKIGQPTTTYTEMKGTSQDFSKGDKLNSYDSFDIPPYSSIDDTNIEAGLDTTQTNFKLYRPECKQIPNPHTYRQAIKKYKRKEGSIEEMERAKGKPLTNRSIRTRHLVGSSKEAARTSLIASMSKPKRAGISNLK